MFLASLFAILIVLILIAYRHGDIKAIFDGDPAARNILEVLTYPSLYAVSMHRISHWLWTHRVPVLPRVLSQVMRFLTFIEIHPGATIGNFFFIDHGDGVVIGETAVIGDYVIMYHQVTLGGTGKEKGKRHPTIGSHVIIGAGAKILGNITVGDQSKIGSGTIVLKSVPSHSTVVGNPGKIVSDRKKEVSLNLGDIPDPVQEALQKLEREIRDLKGQIQGKKHG